MTEYETTDYDPRTAEPSREADAVSVAADQIRHTQDTLEHAADETDDEIRAHLYDECRSVAMDLENMLRELMVHAQVQELAADD